MNLLNILYKKDCADNENIYQSIEYLKNKKPEGSTNINDALMKAIELIQNDINVVNNINNFNNYNFI